MSDMKAVRQGPGSQRRGRVLVIDDDAAPCAVLRSTLEIDGFDVVRATGPDGLAVMGTRSLDAVLLGLRQTGADDLTYLARLRAMGAFGHLPVLVVIAEDNEEHRQRGRMLGADSYLTRPIDTAMLASHLDELLSRSRLARVKRLAGLRQQPTIPRGLV